MGMEKEELTLVKMSKEEKKQIKEDKKEAKREAYLKISEKDREKQKKYKRRILITSVLFGAALVVLGLMAVSAIPVKAGLFLLVAISLASTYVSRKDK
ncbi:hypothetical protein [[Clostridium] polysaccharolyticum]|uniref:Uncharacterized protein n=1 Tax=[Clostridium] polysaccharolyticum TaxID=29364 RepID=A0A1I0ACS7_9FIRM|nr:hypothetical protein [[Clostridium] polysaccharolyticum]SES91565.1 hypothetical protein SAMN04487772_10568 [[Clostridium] polysaccharolyticum]